MFSFRRRLDYYISSVYVPEVILVVLSWCTFFITPSAVPARISLSITTILTTILLSSSLNSNIPKVSKHACILMVDGQVTAAYFLSVLMVLLSLIACSFATSQSGSSSVKRWSIAQSSYWRNYHTVNMIITLLIFCLSVSLLIDWYSCSVCSGVVFYEFHSAVNVTIVAVVGPLVWTTLAQGQTTFSFDF